MLRIIFPLVVITLSVALPDAGLAAGNSDWVKPATGLIESLESGLVVIGSLVVGIGIMVVGLIAAMVGNMNWNKFGYVIFGGMLVMAGPNILRALLENVQ